MRDWISEDERYDPQCQDVEQARCSCCHELVPADELKHFFGGDQVCAECLGNYLRDNSAEFEQPFIDAHLLEYIRDWWNKFLDRDERDNMMLMMYYVFCLNPSNVDRLKEDRRCFCQTHTEFLDYVEERLC